MTGVRSSAPAGRGARQARAMTQAGAMTRDRAGRFDGNRLAICTLLAAIAAADVSTVIRIADLPIGRVDIAMAGPGDAAAANGNTGNFNGNGNRGSFNGNGNTGNFNGNGNAGSFNGNGNAGSFNGNANCGSGFGNGFSSNGNGNGQAAGDVPAWCRYLKDLNGQLGLPPGVIPDFD